MYFMGAARGGRQPETSVATEQSGFSGCTKRRLREARKLFAGSRREDSGQELVLLDIKLAYFVEQSLIAHIEHDCRLFAVPLRLLERPQDRFFLGG